MELSRCRQHGKTLVSSGTSAVDNNLRKPMVFDERTACCTFLHHLWTPMLQMQSLEKHIGRSLLRRLVIALLCPNNVIVWINDHSGLTAWDDATSKTLVQLWQRLVQDTLLDCVPSI